MTQYEVDSGRDKPSPRDWHYRDRGGSENELPKKVDLSFGVKIYNQSDSTDTKMACGRYAQNHGVNAMNNAALAGLVYEPRPDRLAFVEMFKTNQYDPIVEGSSLQDQLRFSRHKVYIDGWVKLFTIDEIRTNLANKRAIATGSKKINYSKTRNSDDKVAVIGTGPAHLFEIIGYNDDTKLLKVMNSYGASVYDNGCFYIRYQDILHLYSMYALIDHVDFMTIDQYLMKKRANERAKLAAGFVYGKNPDTGTVGWFRPRD